MQNIRVAFISNSAPFDGGSETFESSFASILSSIDNLNIEPILFHTQFHKSRRRYKSNSNLNEVYFRVGFLTKVLVAFQTSLFLSSLASKLRWPRNKFEKLLRIEGVQVAVFLSPNPLALIVQSLPLVTTVWDLGHRDLPDLPEFTRNNSFHKREFFYQNTLARSWRVLVDSEITKNRIGTLYGVPALRVNVIGLLPVGPESKIKENSVRTIPSKYLFYPAQFWPHKNHKRLIDAFKLVLHDFPELKLVISGSDKGSLSECLNYIDQLNLNSKVIHVGFVKRIEYWSLLINAECLVFPSLLGPTNLPPLEAATVGKKMSISSFHKGQLGIPNTGVSYFNPYSVKEIRNSIIETITKITDYEIMITEDNAESVKKFLLEFGAIG